MSGLRKLRHIERHKARLGGAGRGGARTKRERRSGDRDRLPREDRRLPPSEQLLRHPRQVLERNQILMEVWGYDFGGDSNVLEIYISYLRKKLESNGEPRLIQTVRGIGYMLREE